MEVYIGKKPGRGNSYPSRPDTQNVDVTSGSRTLTYAESFSPLLIGPCVDCDGHMARFFEHLWQYRKVYPQLGHWDEQKKCPTEEWNKWMLSGYPMISAKKKGYRRPPEVYRLRDNALLRGNADGWAPIGHWWNGELLGYVEARKRIYVPIYWRYVEERVRRIVKPKTKKITGYMVLDYDGPDDDDENDQGFPVTLEYLRAKLEDTTAPFGHGYVVAAILAGFTLEQLIGDGQPEQKRLKKE